MNPNGYRVEQSGDGTPLYCWHEEAKYEHIDLTLNVGEMELRVEQSDTDGYHCNLSLDLDVIVELLCRAGFTVREPERDE